MPIDRDAMPRSRALKRVLWPGDSWRRSLHAWNCCPGNEPCYWHRCTAVTRNKTRCKLVCDRLYQWDTAWFCTTHGKLHNAGKLQTTVQTVRVVSPQVAHALSAMGPENSLTLSLLIDGILTSAHIDSDMTIVEMNINCESAEGIGTGFHACPHGISKWVRLPDSDEWVKQENDLSSIPEADSP